MRRATLAIALRLRRLAVIEATEALARTAGEAAAAETRLRAAEHALAAECAAATEAASRDAARHLAAGAWLPRLAQRRAEAVMVHAAAQAAHAVSRDGLAQARTGEEALASLAVAMRHEQRASALAQDRHRMDEAAIRLWRAQSRRP